MFSWIYLLMVNAISEAILGQFGCCEWELKFMNFLLEFRVSGTMMRWLELELTRVWDV
jgi:hypothetical protein